MSVCTKPIVAAKMAVTPPIVATVIMAAWLASYSGNNAATRYTPAATIVAAWMSADTGVGPSIASGSHVWSGNCPDLPMAPMKIKIAASVVIPGDSVPSPTARKMSS